MSKNKQMCQGCLYDFYNHTVKGECGCFETATIVERIQVGTWEPPPYNRARARTVLSCYDAPGIVMLKTDECRVVDNYGEEPSR